jgi:hypothetical protein
MSYNCKVLPLYNLTAPDDSPIMQFLFSIHSTEADEAMEPQAGTHISFCSNHSWVLLPLTDGVWRHILSVLGDPELVTILCNYDPIEDFLTFTLSLLACDSITSSVWSSAIFLSPTMFYRVDNCQKHLILPSFLDLLTCKKKGARKQKRIYSIVTFGGRGAKVSIHPPCSCCI